MGKQDLEDVDDGIVVLPRRVGVWMVAGGFIFLAGQIYFYAHSQAATVADIVALQKADSEARGRGDDIRRRLAEIERDRERIIRIEEQLRLMGEVLKEVRDELKRKH